MADRTVAVRLRLDTTQWAAGSRAAASDTSRLAASARTAASSAERSARATAAAVAGTFRGMAAEGTSALGALDVAAARSSQALAAQVATMTRETASAAVAASRTAEQASAAAAASTRQVAVAAGEIPAAFRSATTAASASLAQLDVTNRASRAATTRTLLAQRQALTAGAAAVAETTAGLQAVTASGIRGTTRLSLAARLTLASAANATQAAVTTAAAATAIRVSAAEHLAAAGAGSAAAGAAAAVARADANARALSGTFAGVAARARTMGSATVAAAGNSEKALKAGRNASLLFVAAFSAAVYESSRFETAMSGVSAATQAGAAELAKLRKAAIAAGASTQYSATQAADAETELAKAGVSTADILGGALRGTLSLAAAGQMDVADSAVVASKAMNAFGLSGAQMSHIADVIAAAAGKSATDVHGLSLAMAQSALLAHQTGLSIEQTAGALALFAQNGLVGSDAGTSLKTMLMRLTPQSAVARAEMDRIGFSAYDASGNFIGWSATAQALQNSLRNLTPEARNSALSVIFGSDAIRAATIVSKAGAVGVDQWTRAANDQGYAARYAATQTNNLEGDLRRLKSALETALIQSGSSANGVLRDMAQQLTAVIRWYSALPPELQQSVTLLGGLVGVVGLVASGLLLLLPRIVTTTRELRNLGLTAERTRVLMSGLGRLALVVGVLTAISYATDKITKAMETAPPNVNKLTNSLIDLADTGKASGEVASKLGDDLDAFGDAVARLAHPGALTATVDELGKIPLIGHKTASLDEATDKVKAVDEALAQLVQSGNTALADQAFKKLSKSAEDNGTSTKKLMTLLPKYGNALTTASTQQKLGADSSKKLGDQAETTADDLHDTRSQVEKLTDALDALNGNAINSAQASIQFQQSLADLKAAVKDSGHSLDDTTAKGRKVKGAFLDAAQGAQAHAEAVAKQTDSQAKGNAVLAKDITALKQQMLAIGFSKTAVDALLKSYARLPVSVTTKVAAQTDAAAAELDALRKKVAAVPAGKSIKVKAPSAAAIADLKAVGYKVATLPNHTIRISVPTSGQRAAVARLKAQIDALRDRKVVLTIEQQVRGGGMSSQGGKNAIETHAAGGIVGHAASGLFVPGYAPRQDTVRAMLSPGEGVLVPETVLRLGALSGLGPAGVVKALNSWGRYGTKFANGGLVGGQRFASGGFVYSPGQVSVGIEDPRARFDDLVGKLRDAWSTYRDAVKQLAEVKKDKHSTGAERRSAQAAATSARAKVSSLDRQLGLPSGARPPTTLNLTSYEKQLTASVAATDRWRSNLARIGRRGGSEIEQLLASMGTAGYSLVNKLAGASEKQFKDIVAKLEKLGDQAKASLADYTQQITTATKSSKAFQDNLLKLSAMGDSALASQLAAQGDDAAAAIAAAAVKSSSAAASANKAAQANAGLLSSDDVANAVALLGAIRAHPGGGIADVLAASGLDWATVRALAPKVAAQIRGVSGSGTFVSQLQGQGVAMARGGILTRPTTVLAAEAGHTESWIPWDGSARSAALLSATARAMGYQLVPAGRYASVGGQAGTTVHHNETRHEWHLHGAHQSFAEQKADLARQMNFVG